MLNTNIHSHAIHQRCCFSNYAELPGLIEHPPSISPEVSPAPDALMEQIYKTFRRALILQQLPSCEAATWIVSVLNMKL